jgi:hypothetical protein
LSGSRGGDTWRRIGTMIVKRLLGAWRGKSAGSTVVVGDEHHDELLRSSLVEPTASVKKLIQDWEGPDGVTYPAQTRVELDAATARDLETRGVLGPTGV